MTDSVTHTVRGLAAPGDIKSAEVNGASLAYRERGSGQPVVFVHGSISDMSIWDAQLDPIGSRYRAIVYSRRYAWPNDELPEGAKDMMQPHVDDLLAFLGSVDAYPAHLVGNSWGAFICLRAAMQQPDAVRSLVLEEPPLVPLITGAPPSIARIAASLLRRPRLTMTGLGFASGTIGPMKKLVKAGQIEASIDRFAQGVLGVGGLASLPEEVRAHMHANASTHIGQALADGGFEPISEAEIASVRTPTLVVTGADSPALFHELATLLTSFLTDSRSLDVPAASHAMHVANPTVVNTAILEFVEQVATSSIK